MRIIKKQSKQLNKKGYPYQNYFLELDNGTKIQIRCAFFDDLKKLDLISVKVD